MKKILVVGASGLIGSALVQFLQTAGYRVGTLSRKKGDWDPDRGYLPKEALAGYDAIVNLAGHSLLSGFWTKKQMEKILHSRVQSTRLLVQTLTQLERPPEVFISASATGYYGDCKDEEVDEAHPAGSGFLAEVCRAWEEEANRSTVGRTVVLRMGLVLAPHGGALTFLRILFRLCLGGRLGKGTQWMSWIGIDDLMRLFQFVLDEKAISGPVNATSPCPVTNKVFTETLAKVLRRPAFLHVPESVLHLTLGRLADEMLLPSAKVMPVKAVKAGFVFQQQNLEKTFLKYL
jgi:uncharacterized protein